MSARDELFRRVAGAFINDDRANALLDAYRAEVLAEVQTALKAEAAVEKRRSQMPVDQSFAHGFAMAAALVGDMRKAGGSR